MNGVTTRILFSAHSAVGIVLGAALFVVCLSGTVALFVDEATPWSSPGLRVDGGTGAAGLDSQLSALRETFAAGPVAIVIAELDVEGGLTRISWRRPGDAHNRIVRIDPSTGAALGGEHAAWPAFLTDLHTDLLLPKPWGRYVVGLSGLVMLLSAATGILVHRKPLRQAFTCRRGRSHLLRYTDWHKLMGLWGLPFHLMIAYTGALLGLAGILIVLTGGAAFDGDVAAANKAFQGETPPRAGEAAAPPRLDPLIADARARYPGRDPARVIVHHYGDAAATVKVDLDDPGRLSQADTRVVYDATTGAFRRALPVEASVGRRTYAAITPLHYASYGGLALKLVYAVLGLGATLLSASGTLIWLERRSERHGAIATARDRPRIEALAAGFFGGMPVATLAGFHLAVWSAAFPAIGGYGSLAVAFFGLWLAACLAGAVAASPRRCLRASLAVAALLAIGLPLSNGLATGDWLPTTLAAGDWSVAGFDLAAIAVAATLFTGCRRLAPSRGKH